MSESALSSAKQSPIAEADPKGTRLRQPVAGAIKQPLLHQTLSEVFKI